VIALFRDELGYRFLGDWNDSFESSDIDILTMNENE